MGIPTRAAMKRFLEKLLNGGAVGPTSYGALAGNENRAQVIINRVSAF